MSRLRLLASAILAAAPALYGVYPGGSASAQSASPSVITTEQRITPAGAQTVFQGRVRGVAFGAADNELWVLVAGNNGQPSGAWRLGWKENRVLGTVNFTQPGMQAIRLDAAQGAPLVAYIGAGPEPVQGAAS